MDRQAATIRRQQWASAICIGVILSGYIVRLFVPVELLVPVIAVTVATVGTWVAWQ
jgi:hypothetical protein